MEPGPQSTDPPALPTTAGHVWKVPFSPAAIATYATLLSAEIALHAATVTPDYFVRIASGRLVVNEHIIPRHDPFTFTVRGRSWIDHEWLIGAVMYVTQKVSYELLVVLAALAALLPFVIVHRLATKDRRDDWLLLALVAAAFAVAWRTFAIRPQLINPIIFIAIVWLIDDRRRTHSSKIWLIAPLMLVWSNLQAGFLVGPAVVGAWTLICVIERRDVGVSLAVLGASLIVPVVNPYGIDLYRYALTASVGPNVDRALVLEWRSPDFHDPLNAPALLGMVVLFYFGVRSAEPFRRVLAIGTVAASLISARFVPFFALSLVYVVAPQMPYLSFPRWGLRAFTAAITAGLLVSIAAVVGTATNDAPLGMQPTAGLAYLKQNAPNARLYADQSWASYLTWTGWPTFFDTRTHQVFPESLIADYHKVEMTRGDWLAVLDRWQIDYVMMAPDSDLAEALDAAGWKRVFEGPIEVIWRRPAPAAD